MSAPTAQAEVGRDQLETVRRGAPLVLITTAIVTALAVAISLRQESLYKAAADVFISAQPTNNNAIGALSFLSSDPERVLETQADVARVPRVAVLAMKDGPPGVSPSELLGSSSVSADPNADVLSFSVTDPNPDTARRLANAYAGGFVAYRRQQDTGSLRQARSELDQRIAKLRASGASPNDPTLGKLLQDSQRLRTRELLQGSNSSVGNPASGAAKVQPRPVRDGFLGALLGLALGIGLVFVRNALNTRVRSASEIEERLGIPLLGRIPPSPKRLAQSNRLAVIEEPHSTQSEAYRMLATNIELLNLDRGAKSFMVASAVRGEGKSTTAASLAITFARRGLHVVLMEADLRRPGLGKMLLLEEGPGLTDVALGRAGLEQALASTRLSDDQVTTNGAGEAAGTLEVLEAGPAPSSPPEFLKSQPVAQIVSQLTDRGDLLIIDTPPLLQVSDATTMMLTAQIDCVLVAARIGTVRRQAIDEMKRTLDTAPVVNLGFFATGEHAHEEYTGGYGYDYYSRGRARGVTQQPSAKGRSPAKS